MERTSSSGGGGSGKTSPPLSGTPQTPKEEIGACLTRRAAQQSSNLCALSYLDDTVLIGRRSEIFIEVDVFAQYASTFLNLHINRSKSLIFDPTLGLELNTYHGLKVARSGLSLLGGPLGDSPYGAPLGEGDFISDRLGDSISTSCAIIPFLTKELPAPYAFKLLAACVNARPTHLSRLIATSRFQVHAEAFDGSIQLGTASLIGWSGVLPATACRLLSLPTRLAGAGVPASLRASVCHSRHLSLPHFQPFIPSLKIGPTLTRLAHSGITYNCSKRISPPSHRLVQKGFRTRHPKAQPWFRPGPSGPPTLLLAPRISIPVDFWQHPADIATRSNYARGS